MPTIKPPTPPKTTLKVTVRFPISPAVPLEETDQATQTVGDVRAHAMAHFAVHEDPQSAFHLTYERQRQDDSVVLGDLAAGKKSLAFTLVKELVQGDA